MGNTKSLGCGAMSSFRCVYVPQRKTGVKRIGPPAAQEKEDSTPTMFNVKEESQLDDILEEIERALSTLGESKLTEEDRLTSVQNNITDAGNLLSTVSQNCQALKSQVDGVRLAKESMKVVCEVLGGASNLHWAGAALAMVAYVLKRVDQVDKNDKNCICCLKSMSSLAKHIRILIPQLEEYDAKLREATYIIARGTALCCVHLKKGQLSKVLFAGTTKDDMDQLRIDIDRLYPDLNLSAVEVLLDRTKILTRQISLPLSPLTPGYPVNKVGLDERVDVVMKKLMMHDPCVRAVVLHGMGGIGKSTLGDGVYARLNPLGRTHCKIEMGENPSAQHICALQANIIERLSGIKYRLGDQNEGRQKLGMYLQKECVDPLFIYIDNVLNAENLNDLLPEKLILPQKSRLLITSRVSNVCAVLHGKDIQSELHEVEELDFAQAKKLLCMQVFDKQEPPADKQIQVTEVLKACGRLPLALEIVGKYLSFHQRENAWSHAITSLQTWDSLTGTKDDRLIHKLKFSYDQLTESQQKAFLDITAFYLDLPWEMVSHVIGEDRLVILEDLALVRKKRLDIDDTDRVHVHDLLVALGRNTDYGVRIWSAGADELPPILKDDDVDVRKVEGLCLRNCAEVLMAETLDKLSPSLRVLILEQDVTGQCKKTPTRLQHFITKGAMPFQHLQKLTQLAVLSLCEVDMDFINAKFPDKLKVLTINECKCLRELPGDFRHLRLLHTLDLSLCEDLQKLPTGFGQLTGLQSLELRQCRLLKELPEDFVHLKALQRLNLGGCENLAALPWGFGKLTMLQQLMLWQCGHLAELPQDFGRLASLQELNLCGCQSLTTLPENFGRLSGLESLELRSCRSLKELPKDFVHLKALQWLDLSYCDNLAVLPNGFGQLKKLQQLILKQCRCLTALPEDFGQLVALEELNLYGCENLTQLPESFGCLPELHTLSLACCSRLSKLSENFGSLSSLVELKLISCDHLKELPKSFTQLNGTLKLLDVADNADSSNEWVHSVGRLVDCPINYHTEPNCNWWDGLSEVAPLEVDASEVSSLDSDFSDQAPWQLYI